MDTASSISGVAALLLGGLLFFVSIVWLIFPFIVMSRMRSLQAELKLANRNTFVLSQEVARSNEFLAVIAKSTEETALPPGATNKLKISKDGEDLGPLDIETVKTMLDEGQLTLQDYYFDSETKEWYALDGHPAFV
jgi:uncharacterized protein (DUF58 family)